MSNALSEHWQYTTICIEDDLNEIVGTGVLIADTPTERDKYGGLALNWGKPLGRVYLATARHVLGANESEISETVHYFLRYNGRIAAEPAARRSEFAICNSPPNWAIHQDTNIDVAVLDVTQWVAGLTDAHLCFCPLSEVANPTNLMNMDCEAGDDVFVLGYPLTLRQGRTNLPIFRKGVLATSPRRVLEDGGRSLRGFLVDGAIMPGSSGSPVISLSTEFHRGDTAVTPHRTLLLGIVSQEWGRGELARYDTSHRHNAQQVPIEGYANLGFAHSASAIVETIARLGHNCIQDFLRFDREQHWSPALGVDEWSLEFTGTEVDAETSHRIMLRLHRDRMRDRGFYVKAEDYFDIPERLGPVRDQGPPPANGILRLPTQGSKG